MSDHRPPPPTPGGKMNGQPIPIIRSHETLGPFSIEIPEAAVLRAIWCERTTRWERWRWDHGLLSKAKCTELALRMIDVMDR